MLCIAKLKYAFLFWFIKQCTFSTPDKSLGIACSGPRLVQPSASHVSPPGSRSPLTTASERTVISAAVPVPVEQPHPSAHFLLFTADNILLYNEAHLSKHKSFLRIYCITKLNQINSLLMEFWEFLNKTEPRFHYKTKSSSLSRFEMTYRRQVIQQII